MSHLWILLLIRTASLSSKFVCKEKAARVSVLSSLSIILRIRSSYVPVFIDCTFALLLLEYFSLLKAAHVQLLSLNHRQRSKQAFQQI